MNFNEGYQYGAQIIYALTIVTVVCVAAVRFASDPTKMAGHYFSRRGRAVFVPLLALGVLGALLLAVAWVTGGIGSKHMMVNLLLTGALVVGSCVAVMPLAMELESEQKETPPQRWGRKEISLLVMLSLAAIVWSVGVFTVMPFFVPFDVPEESMVAQISPARGLEFAAFCAFALMAAFGEEIVFRGGAQALLERAVGAAGAVAIVSLIFATGHGGYTDVVGIKEIQIFGIAVLFGIARVRCGLAGAVVVHVANNGFSLGAAWLNWVLTN